MRKKFTFIYVLLAAIFTLSSCDSGSGGGTGSGGSGGGGIKPNSYGVGYDLELINKAFYTYESEDGFTVYSLVFSSDNYADPNGSDLESYFLIEFPETCLGKTIALDAERGGEEGFFLYFDLTIGKTHYFYEADYIHNGFVDIEAGVEDFVNDIFTDLEVKGGSFKVTKDGDTFTVNISARLGDHNITCQYAGEPELVEYN